MLERFSALRDNIKAETSLRPAETARGRALVTTTAVSAQEQVFSIPLTNVLCVTDDPSEGQTAIGRAALASWEEAHGSISGLLRELLLGTLPAADARWDLRLLAWLLWLRRNGKGPIWTDYCQLLPQERECSLLLSYHPWERDELQKPSLVREACDQRASADYYHMTMSKLGFNARDKPQDTFRYLAAIRSRAFSLKVKGEEITLLVPFADLANHAARPDIRFDYDELSSAFVLRSVTKLEAGTEVHISYGAARDNDELMRDYGFIVEDNVYDRVNLSNPGGGRVLPIGPVRGPKVHPGVLIRTLGLSAEVKDGELVLDNTSADVATIRRNCALYSLPLVGAMSQLPIPQLSAFWPAAAFATAGLSSLKEYLTEAEVAAELQAVGQLRASAAQQLANCATTAEEDETLLQEAEKKQASPRAADEADPGPGQGIPTARLIMAIRARLHWKRLLQEAISILDEYEAKLQAGAALSK